MNIISGDFDDLRTADIPIVFQGYDFITIKLICTDYQQNYEQMKNRGSGLIDYDLLIKSTQKIMSRPLLVNEVSIDVARKTPEDVMREAVALIDNSIALNNYEYQKPPRELIYFHKVKNERMCY